MNPPAHRDRSRNRRDSRGSDDDDDKTVVDRAKGVVDKNFTHTPTGIGASLLGAVVGGLAAREAASAAHRRRHASHRPDPNEERTRLASTIVGALAGGIGANALANRVETSRVRDKERQRAWEEKWGASSDEDDYKGRRSGEGRRSRDRSRGRLPPPRRESDDDYDHVYDDRERRRRRDDDYR